MQNIRAELDELDKVLRKEESDDFDIEDEEEPENFDFWDEEQQEDVDLDEEEQLEDFDPDDMVTADTVAHEEAFEDARADMEDFRFTDTPSEDEETASRD
jgi:hypothetical protein